jgi:cytochrome c
MIRVLLAGLIAAVHFAIVAQPASAHSPDEVQALVERAAEHIRAHGRQQAFDDFNRPDGGFVDGELYIFCFDDEGIERANGGNPKFVGKNLSKARDAGGKLTYIDMWHIGQTNGQGWYEYTWPNPVKGRIQQKVAYVLRIDDQTVCASGYYKPDQP